MHNNCFIIDGKKKAENLFRLQHKITKELYSSHGIKPGLAVILVGDDPASHIYVQHKLKRAKEIEINSYIYKFKSDVAENELLECICKLNKGPEYSGILLQLPIPAHLNEQKILNSICVEKDVDGFHVENVGLLNTWQECLVPCTPLGVMFLLAEAFQDLRGKKAIVLGRSRIVGRPMSSLLIRAGLSVLILNSHSKNTEAECRSADILISAVGKPKMIKSSWIKPGACVIDVGISRVSGALVGDVEFEEATRAAGYITPVPGGVGPMTVASLMFNTIKAAYKQNNLNTDKLYRLMPGYLLPRG